ncbi:hypothetical protein IJZ97_03560 [bacterium]|nr:hypothetical protein [bacterium]
MKLLVKIVVLFVLFVGNCVGAEPFKVLVLPVDLFSVCENYYCFPEVSEIVANDVINYFALDQKVQSSDLYEVRKKISENPQLKSAAISALNKYKNSNTVDFESLRKISQGFGSKSILLISSSVVEKSSKRNAWEVLEVSSAFEAYNTYNLETSMVLTDNVNDVVMWSGKYKRQLGDNEKRFWAKNSASAVSQLEKITFYSKDIIAKNAVQNILLRFYPKIIKTATPKSSVRTQTRDFRPNALDGMGSKLLNDNEYGEIQSDTIFNF